MKTKRKVGRPSAAPADRRDARVAVGFTKRERMAIDRRAKSLGLSRMAYMRWITLRDCRA